MPSRLHLINETFGDNANGSLSNLLRAFAPLTWDYYVANFKVTTTTTITTGTVYTLVQGTTTAYRYVSTATGTDGYPTTDAIYSTFDGTSLPTGLIVQRGV